MYWPYGPRVRWVKLTGTRVILQNINRIAAIRRDGIQYYIVHLPFGHMHVRELKKKAPGYRRSIMIYEYTADGRVPTRLGHHSLEHLLQAAAKHYNICHGLDDLAAFRKCKHRTSKPLSARII